MAIDFTPSTKKIEFKPLTQPETTIDFKPLSTLQISFTPSQTNVEGSNFNDLSTPAPQVFPEATTLNITPRIKPDEPGTLPAPTLVGPTRTLRPQAPQQETLGSEIRRLEGMTPEQRFSERLVNTIDTTIDTIKTETKKGGIQLGQGYLQANALLNEVFGEAAASVVDKYITSFDRPEEVPQNLRLFREVVRGTAGFLGEELNPVNLGLNFIGIKGVGPVSQKAMEKGLVRKIGGLLATSEGKEQFWKPLTREIAEAAFKQSDETVFANADDVIRLLERGDALNAAIRIDADPVLQPLFKKKLREMALGMTDDQALKLAQSGPITAESSERIMQAVARRQEMSKAARAKLDNLPAYQKNIDDFRAQYSVANEQGFLDRSAIEHRKEIINALRSRQIISKEALEAHPELFKQVMDSPTFSQLVKPEAELLGKSTARTPKVMAKAEGFKDNLFTPETPVVDLSKVQLPPSPAPISSSAKILGTFSKGQFTTGAGFDAALSNMKKAIKNLKPLKKKGIPKASDIVPEIGRAREFKLRADRPLRLFDNLDGNQKFEGPLSQFFYHNADSAENAKITRILNRQQKVNTAVETAGLDANKLSEQFILKSGGREISYTKSELLTLAHASDDEFYRAAIVHGNKIPEEHILEAKNLLSKQELDALDALRAVEGENVKELEEYVTNVLGKNFVKMDKYHRISRIGSELTPESALIDEFNFRQQVSKAPRKGFTIERQVVPEEFQTPVNLDFMGTMLNSIEQQEHLLAYGKLAKQWNKALQDRELKTLIQTRVGKEGFDLIKRWVDHVIDPSLVSAQRNFLSQMFRKNSAVYYLGFNLMTMLKQAPSMVLMAPHMSVRSFADNIIKYSSSKARKELKEFVFKLDPQMKARVVERDLVEIFKKANPKGYQRVVEKLGKASMAGIMKIDETVVLNGWKTIYDTAVRRGLSEDEAVKLAHRVLLNTQPQGRIKDLPDLFRGTELETALTQFGNQLNQIWNIMSNDIPVAFKHKNYKEAAALMTATATSGILMSMLTRGGNPPQTPEEAVKFLVEQPISAIPLLGPAIVSGMNGFQDVSVPSLMALKEVASVSKDIATGQTDKIAKDIVDALGLSTGLPINQLLRSASGIKDLIEGDTDDLRRLAFSAYTVGEKGKKKKSNKSKFDF